MENRIFPDLWPDWKTVRMIGRGSFGAVYEIERHIIDGTVEKAALKLISLPQNKQDIAEMYQDGYTENDVTEALQSHANSIVAEYTLMKKMNGCPNVVFCDDVRYARHDDGIGWDFYIKMELLNPLVKTLPELIPERTVINLAKDMCRALEMCHKHDIIHRDIKPQNIFVSDEGMYKLGDFGIAKTIEKTMGGTKIGTYKYMAPEVYNNQPYGKTVDIYSLGLVMYWMLNERRLPFLPLPPEKINVHMEEVARQRRFSGETIPAPKSGSSKLRDIVLKACDFDPRKRFQSAGEMLAALNALDYVPPVPQPRPDPNPVPPPPPVRKPKTGLIIGLIVGGILGVAALVGIGFAAANIISSMNEKNNSSVWQEDVSEQTGISQSTEPGQETEPSQTEEPTSAAQTELKIVGQPKNASAAIGEKVSVAVTAEGDGLTYQWFIMDDGAKEFKESSIVTDVYTTEMNEKRNGREIYCVVTDQYGNKVSSDIAILSLKSTIVIEQQPQDASAKYGEKVQVTIKATGEDLSYQWFIKNNDSKRFAQSSSVTDTYITEMNEERDGRKIYCVVTDKYGNSITSDTATLSLRAAIVINQQPKDASAKEGEKVEITVKATGDGLKYQWYIMDVGSKQYKKSSAVTETYITEMNAERDGRQLYCVITDKDGKKVSTHVVTISLKK